MKTENIIQIGDTEYQIDSNFLDGMKDARNRVYDRSTNFRNYPGMSDAMDSYETGHALQIKLIEEGI